MNYTLYLCFCYINIYMNEYKQLQAIYEGQGGLSRDTAPNDSFTAASSKHSFRYGLPFNAGGSENVFASRSNDPLTRVIVPGESEEEQIDGEISKQSIIAKIKELQNVAAKDERRDCVHTLGTLIKFIKKG